jgi:energy-coupling factor transport system permease protein
MRSPLSYTPRPGILQRAAPGAAIAYLGALVAIAFLYSSPLVLAATGVAAAVAGVLAGASGAVRLAARMGLALALLITVVNGLVTDRGDTVLARLGEWPLLGQVNVTAEALAAGAVIGLRAAVVMIALAVYSACVDPDLVLRSLRPLAGRSALTATLISRMVPLAAADASRLSEAAALRGPAAAPAGRGPLARRLLAGSLDRAVDAAASLELRGYGLDRPASRRRVRSRHDRRLYVAGALLITAGIAGKVAGADGFDAYPALEASSAAPTVTLALLVALSGLVVWQRSRRA